MTRGRRRRRINKKGYEEEVGETEYEETEEDE